METEQCSTKLLLGKGRKEEKIKDFQEFNETEKTT